MIGNNMFAYCNNNPVMFVDPTGEMSKGAAIALGILAYVVTGPGGAIIVHDVYQLSESKGQTTQAEAGDNLGYTVDPKNGTIQIHNSHKIWSPFTQSVYGLYLNHFNKDTKDQIKGTTVGVTAEWIVHNFGYQVSSIVPIPGIRESSEHLNLGCTMYNNEWYVCAPTVIGAVGIGLLKGGIIGAIAYPIIDAIIYNRNR